MAKTVIDVARDNIALDRKAAEDQIVSGGVRDWTQYREVVGLIRGLDTATAYLNDLARNMEENDD